VVAVLIISQAGVTGAEKDDTTGEFTVVGDGELPTKKPTLGDGRAPLSSEETGYAIHLATTDARIPRDATNVRGEDDPEYLYAELPNDVDTTGRKATVALYDYTDNKTYHQVVDLKAGKVIGSQAATKLQPPTSADEATAAISIALTATPPLSFVTEFEQIEGVPLIADQQITYRSSAWVYDKTTSGGAECGVERCARLSVTTPTGVFLNTSDFVVNLSRGSVIKLEQP
jgi:hypothetical protein